MNTDDLNLRLGIPGVARVEDGNGGLPRVSVTTALCSAEIYLYGAQVTSWRPVGSEEVIFLSEKSHWEQGRAIRGGIPVCFPWFRDKADDAKAPKHGFVRTREWRLEGIAAHGDGSVAIVCATDSDESTRQWWPHAFRLVNRITVGKTLRLDLTVTNTSNAPFQFEEALHTYFHVGAVEGVRVRGLDGALYLDNTDGNRHKTQLGDLVISGPTDNAYIGTEDDVEILDPVLERGLRTEKQNSKTTVAWNPWAQGAASLSDLGGEEWHRMMCVEASNILSEAVSLAPGEEHTMSATIKLFEA